MNLQEFNLLHTDQQVKLLLEKGSVIGKTKREEYWLFVYNIFGFNVELKYYYGEDIQDAGIDYPLYNLLISKTLFS